MTLGQLLSVILTKRYRINKVQRIHKIHIHFTFQKQNIILDQVQDQTVIVEVEFLPIIM
jgi:hypothetical protein